MDCTVTYTLLTGMEYVWWPSARQCPPNMREALAVGTHLGGVLCQRDFQTAKRRDLYGRSPPVSTSLLVRCVLPGHSSCCLVWDLACSAHSLFWPWAPGPTSPMMSGLGDVSLTSLPHLCTPLTPKSLHSSKSPFPTPVPGPSISHLEEDTCLLFPCRGLSLSLLHLVLSPAKISIFQLTTVFLALAVARLDIPASP